MFEQLFKTTIMRITIFLISFVFAFIDISAQTSKTIKIEDDGEVLTVEITTTTNGTTTIEKLEGEEAQTYIDRNNDGLVNIQLSKSDLQSIEREISKVSVELEQLVREIEVDVDSIVNNVERELKTKSKCQSTNKGSAI